MKCSADDCEDIAIKKEACLCGKHYARLRRHGNPNIVLLNPRSENGVRKICEVDGCDKPVSGKGLCETHRQRFKKYNHAGSAKSRRRANGEGTVNNKGYLVTFVDGKYKKMHRLVAEKALGKSLPPNAVVHHLNGDKTDNRPCNLVVCPNEAYHQMLHMRQRAYGYNGPEIPSKAE